MKSIIVAIALVLTSAIAYAQGESVVIKGPNADIKAEYHLPASYVEGKKCPLVILCHGFGGTMQDQILRQTAARLEQEGIATLLFDFAGSGQSVSKKFSFVDVTPETEKEDLEAVIKYASKLPFAGKIGLLGHSMGGAVSILASAEVGKRTICSLVLLAPAISMREEALRGCMLGNPFNPFDIPKTIKFGDKIEIGRKFVEVAQKTNFLKKATEYKGKTLILFSTDDMAVCYTSGEYLEMVMPDAKLLTYKNLGHCFYNEKKPETQADVTGEVAKFFSKELK